MNYESFLIGCIFCGCPLLLAIGFFMADGFFDDFLDGGEA